MMLQTPTIVLNCAMADADQQHNKQADHSTPSSDETRAKAKEKKSNRNVGVEGGNR